MTRASVPAKRLPVVLALAVAAAVRQNFGRIELARRLGRRARRVPLQKPATTASTAAGSGTCPSRYGCQARTSTGSTFGGELACIAGRSQ